MVAALGDLQIAVMARRQFDIRLGDQVDIRTLGGRGIGMDRVHHLFVLMRTCHGEDLRMGSADGVGLLTHAAGHDHTTIFCDCFAYGSKAFFLGRIEKAACIHKDHIGTGVIRAHRIAIRA